MKHQRSPLASATIHTALILGAVVMVFPLLWMLVTSIKTITEATIIPPTLWPDVPQWQNWMDVLIGDGVLQTFFHTLLIALLALALQLLTSSTGAYAFARLTFPGRDRIFLMFMASLMVPTFVTLIPTYLIAQKLSLLDSYTGILLPYFFTPFGVFLLRQSFMQIPRELEESIVMDGGSYFTRFASLMLPLCRSQLLVLGVFSFTAPWNDLLWPMIVVDSPELRTLPVVLSMYKTTFTVDLPHQMAAASVGVIPMLVFYIFSQRYFMESVVSSGVKG